MESKWRSLALELGLDTFAFAGFNRPLPILAARHLFNPIWVYTNMWLGTPNVHIRLYSSPGTGLVTGYDPLTDPPGVPFPHEANVETDR